MNNSVYTCNGIACPIVAVNGWKRRPEDGALTMDIPEDVRKDPLSNLPGLVAAEGLLTEYQAADYVGLAVQTLRNWRKERNSGAGPAYKKINGYWIGYSIHTLTRWKEKRQ